MSEPFSRQKAFCWPEETKKIFEKQSKIVPSKKINNNIWITIYRNYWMDIWTGYNSCEIPTYFSIFFLLQKFALLFLHYRNAYNSKDRIFSFLLTGRKEYLIEKNWIIFSFSLSHFFAPSKHAFRAHIYAHIRYLCYR